MRDERDPVPGWDLALVAVERLRDGPGGVVEAEEPEDPNEEFADLGALVESGGLEVAADGVGGDREVVGLLLVHAVVVLAPLGPGLREAHVHRDGEVERLVRFLVKVELFS